MASFNVTRRALSLGNQDSTTGWYAKSFATSTISMPILRRGESLIGLPMGLYARHDYVGFTSDTVAEGDEILQAVGGDSNYYQVNMRTPHYWGDSLYTYECELNYMGLWALRPSTSGTWISVTDPANRIKVLLDTYLTAANMKEDDNATNATTITAFGMPDYPIQLVFLGTKNVDMTFSIDMATSTPFIDSDYLPYGYSESVPLEISTIDKTGITARRLLWAGVHEVRRILEENSTGTVSYRFIKRSEPTPKSLGGMILWSIKYEIAWNRSLT